MKNLAKGRLMHRPKVGDFINETDYTITTVSNVKEDDTKLVIRYLHVKKKPYYEGEDMKSYYSAEKHQKFLCVGGPLNGRKMVPEEAEGYQRYNNAYGRWRDKTSCYGPKVVLVYVSNIC